MDGLEPVEGLEHRTETITGPAGNEITLYVTRPADVTGPCRASCTSTAAAW